MSFLKHAACFILQPLVDFIYPPYCCLCHAAVTFNAYPVCLSCLQKLKRDENPCIDSRPFAKNLPDGVFFSHTIAAYQFVDDVQELVHALKYRQMPVLAKSLGTVLGEICLNSDAFHGVDLIVPVPLHSSRLRERGYNQAALIAHAVSAVTGIPVDDKLLLRHRITKQQAKCTASERYTNVHLAFSLRQPHPHKNKIAVVDDVLTTGVTINECAHVLRDAGVAQIIAVSLVRIL